MLITIGFIIVRCSEEAPECPIQNQSPSGKLIVKSNPSGARIHLLGTDTGKNTPDSIDNLQPGMYDLFLYLQYYDTAFFTATIANNLTTTKEITLNPLPINTGKLVVKSNPSGARIYLFGTDTGKNTPDSIDNLQPGTYDAFLYLLYYDTAHFTATIESNLTTTKEITLNPLTINTGRLVVKSVPSGAQIYLMGINTGKNTPDSLLNLAPGIYDLFLYLQYYDTAYFTAQIIPNLTTTKEIVLVDGLPFVDIVLDYIMAFNNDSVKFKWILNQDVLMDSIIVQRPVDNSPLYVIDKYFYNNEFFVWKDQFGNPINYYLPPPDLGPNYYPKVEGFTYEFNFYGQKAHGTMTSFHLFFSQEI